MSTPEAKAAVDAAVKSAIEDQARGLIIAARAAGYNVEISPRPLQPLAMRNYELAITVWPYRS